MGPAGSTAARFHFEVVEVPDDKLDLFEQTKLLFVTHVDGDVQAVQTRIDPNSGAIGAAAGAVNLRR